MAMNDPQMQRLTEQEGLRGSGAYWVIIEKLSLLPEPRATLEYLRPFCNKKIPFSYLKKIILEYQLFTLDEDGYFSPVELNATSKKRKKTAENESKNKPETAKSPSLFAENEQKSDRKQPNPSEKKSENEPEIPTKALENCRIGKNKRENKEENIKDNTITPSSSLAERKRNPPYTTTDEFGNCQVLHPIVSWEESLKNLSEDSGYIDLAFMRCGYGELLKRRFKDAVEYFRRHIILYHKQDNLPNEYEVYKYFANFTAAGARTSTELRNYLRQLDEADRLEHPNAYRFEKLIDGKRTYNGCPLPADAPPRPNDRCLWNNITGKWV